MWGGEGADAFAFGGGSGGRRRVWTRRLRVECSGTASATPTRRTMEPTRPSVWRNGSGITARKVKAVVIARSEWRRRPPGVVRVSARQRATVSGVNQTVRPPHARRPASYSAQPRTNASLQQGRWLRCVVYNKGHSVFGIVKTARPARTCARITDDAHSPSRAVRASTISRWWFMLRARSRRL